MSDASPIDFQLPWDVRGPLRAAVAVVAGFLMFVGIWSATAEITTTLRVPGVIAPSAPSFELQHPRGGRIGDVLVELHDRVARGDILFHLDTRELILRRDALEQRRGLLIAELDEVAPRLDLPGDGRRAAEVPALGLTFASNDATLAAEIADLDARIRAAEDQLALIDVEDRTSAELMGLLSARLQKTRQLAERGVAPARDAESLERQFLQMEVEAVNRAARRLEAEREIVAARAAREIRQQSHRNALAEAHLRITRELSDIDAELARIGLSIQQSDIRAPVGGMITELPMNTPDMVAGPGQTLAVISQPLSDPEIDLFIPPSYIDQVALGQTGQLTVTSLAQRTAPRLTLELTDVAEEPMRDAEGNTLHYAAHARVSVEDLEVARSELGDRFQLAVGMPVSAALAGAPTTLWAFVTQPLTTMLTGAFED